MANARRNPDSPHEQAKAVLRQAVSPTDGKDARFIWDVNVVVMADLQPRVCEKRHALHERDESVVWDI